MAKFQVTSPDGEGFEVTAPDGASNAEVIAYAQTHWQAKTSQVVARTVKAEGRTFSFPNDATDDEISQAVNVALPPPIADNIPFYKDSSIITGGIFLLAILIIFFFLKKYAPAKLVNLYSVYCIIGRWVVKNFQKILIIAAVLFIFWMFRYEAFSTRPTRCLDRWYGEVVSC